MEVNGWLLLACVIFAGLAVCCWWRAYRQRREVYDFAYKLEQALMALMDGRMPEALPASDDDLWGKFHDRLQQLAMRTVHMNDEVVAEKESLKSLVADISHQTKTPLANIQLYLERLEDTAADDADTVRKMRAQVDKLNFLLESMVKISRLETGAIHIRKESSCLVDTLADAISGIMPLADRKGIRVQAEIDEGLRLVHDRRWTAEALHNLLDNAVKYTPPGGEIGVSVREEPFFVAIAVRDSGKGIALERQGAIFTRFYREPEVHAQEGCGLGLYLARQIAALEGGYIEVQSAPGAGSTFTFYLPHEA